MYLRAVPVASLDGVFLLSLSLFKAISTFLLMRYNPVFPLGVNARALPREA